MRIRKRNRIIKRMVLGFAVLALVLPSASMAYVDEGISGQPNSAEEIAKDQGSVQLADPKYGQESGVSVVLADPKFGHETRTSVQLADPKYGQSVEETIQLADPKYGQSTQGSVQLADPKYGQEPVYVSTPQSTPQVVSSDGVDWGDAGIGAGILAGLMVVIGGAALAARQLGRPQTA